MKKIVKTFIVLLIMSFTFSVSSCSNDRIVKNDANYKVVIVDSCEYIIYYSYNYGIFGIAHKGNCKFCAERNRLNK
jgi:hypothetical protein